MKKGLSVALAAALIGSVAIMPVSAEEWNGEAITVIMSEDFEGDHGFPLYENQKDGEVVVAGKIDGNALRLNRCGSTINRTNNYDGLHAEADLTSGKVLVEFDYLPVKQDGFGTAVRLVQTAGDMKRDWNWDVVFILQPNNGKPALFLDNGGSTTTEYDSSRAGYDAYDLELGKVSTISLVFTIGSQEYDAYVNGKKVATATCRVAINSIYGLRFYHHGYSTDDESKKEETGWGDETYFDNFMMATFGAASGEGPAPTPDPDPTPSTGDALAVSAIVMAAAAGAALVISKKRK